jgi:glycosyltransferase involved in cell wall biosynthesis
MVAGTSAVNKTLARARGELITHLDDDDEYPPERLEKLVSFVRANDCDLVWHPFWYEDADGRWRLNEAAEFAFSRVTTSSVLYRSWFKKIRWDIDAHRLMEPGDWNRFRRLRYLGAVCMRFPEPMLRHYRERRPDDRRTTGPGS